MATTATLLHKFLDSTTKFLHQNLTAFDLANMMFYFHSKTRHVSVDYVLYFG